MGNKSINFASLGANLDSLATGSCADDIPASLADGLADGLADSDNLAFVSGRWAPAPEIAEDGRLLILFRLMIKFIFFHIEFSRITNHPHVYQEGLSSDSDERKFGIHLRPFAKLN